MALESATYISDLVSSNPTSADNLSQGDDHIRLLKSTLKSTFPNVTGAVTADHTELNKLDGLTATTAQLNYVTGVTSAIQTQLDAKAPLASPTFTGTATLPAINSGTTVRALGGTEGGEIVLEKPPTTSLAGNVVVDIANDRFRFYEGGGTFRGAYVDITQMDEGQSRLLSTKDLVSPAFTGTPTAPTASAYAYSTQIATTAQVFETIASLPYTYRTGSHTLSIVDRGIAVLFDSASGVTCTIPTEASVAWAPNTRIDLIQYGAGQVTVSPAAGVTLRSSGSKTKLSGQYSGATLIKVGTNDWLLIGDLA